MTLQMTEAQFMLQKTLIDTALAVSYGVDLGDVVTSVAAPNPGRRLLDSNSVVIDATINMGTRPVPSDQAIMSSMLEQNFPVELLSLVVATTPVPPKAKDTTFIGRIVSEMPFGDDDALSMTLFVLLVVCALAMCACMAKISGLSACCGCAARDDANDSEAGSHNHTVHSRGGSYGFGHGASYFHRFYNGNGGNGGHDGNSGNGRYSPDNGGNGGYGPNNSGSGGNGTNNVHANHAFIYHTCPTFQNQ